jgi:hypothetical protein
VQIKAAVIQERAEPFQGKRGSGVRHLLLCVDCDSETPLERTFDYLMQPDDVEKYGSRLRDKIVMLGVRDLEPTFGGRIRIKGTLTVLSPLKPKQ